MEPAPAINECEFLESAPKTIADLEKIIPSEEDAHYIRAACEKDRLAGNAGGYLSREQVDELFDANNWVPLPTFDHIQDSGKHRRIDNGRKSKHNSATAYAEELDLCTALQPAIHAKVLMDQAEAILGDADKLCEDWFWA